MKIADLSKKWDIVIVGGGITGAGVLRESARLKLRTLLVEQKDFAWGTSSRSSKLIHGGLRYLKEGKLFLTRDSVKEREKLLREAPGLVEPLVFRIPIYKSGPSKLLMSLGLNIYSLLSGKKQHRYDQEKDFKEKLPFIKNSELKGGFRFMDAQADDARLTIRLIHEALEVNPRAFALNYTMATEVRRDAKGWVKGVVIQDAETEESGFVSTKVVINAAGVWADRLSKNTSLNLRPLRGSHLIFPQEILPVTEAVSFPHHRDGRPVFALPWEGRALVGTTDVDHSEDLLKEPSTSKEETEYLLEGLNAIFPDLNITSEQCLSTIAGIRPVIGGAKRRLRPSEESREHIVLKEKGLVTITGGKLTTFRKLALDALKHAGIIVPPYKRKKRIFNCVIEDRPKNHKLSPWQWRRLYGRYGVGAKRLIESASSENLEEIPGCRTLWAELPYVAKNEKIRHLKDLLLLRLRIGLLVPEGGRQYLSKILKLCRPYLGWNQEQWRKEMDSYMQHWRQFHAPHLT